MFKKLLCLFFVISCLQAMEEQEASVQQKARKLKSLSYPHNPKSLVHIAAKAAFKKVMPEKVDEDNIDETLEQLNTLPSRIGNECAALVQDKVLYAQAYPYFGETPETYLMDACPILGQKIIFSNHCHTILDAREEKLTVNIPRPNHGRDKFKFLGGTYLSYLEDDHNSNICCILNVFENNEWKPIANINPNDQIIDTSLSSDRQLLALGLKNQKVVFWQLKEDTQEWQKNEHEIDLPLFIDTLEASIYNARPGRSYLQNPDKYYHFKKSGALKHKDFCTSISSIAFLPLNPNERPQLLLGLNASECHKHPKEGILTLWEFNLNGWQLKNILRDKHDWPIINIQPSSDGTKVLTHTYASRQANHTTCWEKNNNGDWNIVKRTRQQNPTKTVASFNQTNDSFVQMYNKHAQSLLRYIKQFRSNGTSYSKARKLTITSDVSPAFAFEYEWKTNSTPFIWLNKDEIAISNKVISLNPSLEYGLCQKALETVLSSESTMPEFCDRIKKFLATETFKKLSPDEQEKLKIYLQESTKFKNSILLTYFDGLLNDK